MLQDIDRILEVNKGIQAVTRRILNFELVCDEVMQLAVRRNFIADSF